MSFPLQNRADKGRRIYEALLVMFNRLRDPSLKLTSQDLLAYQNEINVAGPLVEELSGTELRNKPEFTSLVDDHQAILMGRLVTEMHQAVGGRLGRQDYTITLTNQKRLARNKVTYVTHNVLAIVACGDKTYYFALGETGQYSLAEKEYWDDLV